MKNLLKIFILSTFIFVGFFVFSGNQTANADEGSGSVTVIVTQPTICSDPLTQSQTVQCSSRDSKWTGTITQTSTKSSYSSGCAWSGWTDTSNTCSCAAPSYELQTVSCPPEHSGSITQERDKSAYSACSFGSWYQTYYGCTINSYTLTVNKAGTGSGTVGGAGTYDYGTTVTATESPSADSYFAGWGGCNASGQVYMDGNKTCTATFTKKPINCVGGWSACSGGTQTYTITTATNWGGNACPYTNGTVWACGNPASVTSWSACSGGTQSRTCTQASGGGSPTCAGLGVNVGVNTQSCGTPASWSGWSTCSGGTQSGICKQASGGGSPTCAGLGYSAGTNTQSCGVGASVTAWGICSGGSQSRTCTEATGGGAPTCSSFTPQGLVGTNTQSCGTAGYWSGWSGWDSCSVSSCGQTGTQGRTRSCIGPYGGGAPCVGLTTDSQSCSTTACPTGSISASNCSIAQNSNSCNSSVSWSTSSPWGTSAVTTPNSITVANANSSAGTSYPVPNPDSTRTFYLYNNNTLLGQATASASCAVGIWYGGYCRVSVGGVCGSSNGGNFYSSPTINLCSVGGASSVSGSGPWSWSCAGLYLGTTASCSANKAVDCVGSWNACSNGSQTYSISTAVANGGNACLYINGATRACGTTASCSATHYNCSPGTSVSNSSNTSTWTWGCNSTDGGVPAPSCSEAKPAPSAWITASPSSVSYNSQSTLSWGSTNATSCTATGPWSNSGTLSGSGLTNALTANTTFYFQCTGNGQTSALQSVTVGVGSLNGSCGTSNGINFYSSPTSGYCNAGSYSGISGTGPWSWTCAGANLGTTASCSANKSINGGWSAWSAKDNTPGYTGTQTRTCTNPSPAYDGAACAGSSTQSYTNIPSAPTGFGAAASSCNNNWLNLWWKASSGATNYKVYRSGTLVYDGSLLAFSDSGLALASNYSYTITASNAGGTSGTSSTSATVAPICTYNITASSGTNGSISPSGVTTKNYSSSQAYTISPSANYHIVGVLVDGPSVGAVSSYTFSNITTSHTISASFAIDTKVLTINTAGNGTGNITGAGTYNYGTAVTATASASTGSTFAGWSGDCNSSGQVTMTSAKSCTATFTAVTASVVASPTSFSTTPNTNVSFAYTPSTSLGATECRLLNNVSNPLTTTFQPSSPIVYPSSSLAGSYGYYIQCRNTVHTTIVASSALITVNVITVSVSATTPYNTTPGASVSFAYTPTSNPSGATECLLLDNSFAEKTAYKLTSPIIYTIPNSIGAYGYYVKCRNTITTTAMANSGLITVNTACLTGTTWNGSSCVGPTGTLNALPCYIDAGKNSCPSNINWTISNPIGNTVVTTPTNINVVPPTSSLSGSTTYTVEFPGRNFYLYNNVIERATATANATCTSGTVWNASTTKCESPTGTLTAGGCTIPINETGCPSTITWNTTNPLTGVDSIVKTVPDGKIIATGDSGEYTYSLTTTSKTFELWHNGVLLYNSLDPARATPVAVCAPTTHWDGAKCTIDAPSDSNTTFVATPSTIFEGRSSTLTWSSSLATSCTGDGFDTQGKKDSSELAAPVVVSPLETTTYTLRCTNASGSKTKSVIMKVIVLIIKEQ